MAPFDGIGIAVELPGRWHYSRPDTLKNAIAATARATHLRDLGHFLLPHMARFLRCSRNIRCVGENRYSATEPLPVAIRTPWVSFDTAEYRNVIAIDVDHPDGVERAEFVARAYGLPRPTVVTDPWSSRCHVFWRLASPVNVKQNKSVRMAEYAGRLLAAAMGGMLMGRGGLIKCPWGHEKNLDGKLIKRVSRPHDNILWQSHQAADNGLVWHTVPGDLFPVALRDVVAAMADDYGATVNRDLHQEKRREPRHDGRNVHVFDVTRYWAYDTKTRDYDNILARAYQAANDYPSDKGRLGTKEICWIARSICGWMTHVYGGRATTPRFSDPALAALTPRERMTLGARRAAQAKRERNDDQISKAIDRMRRAGHRMTQLAIAAASKLSLSSIKRRWDSLKSRVSAGSVHQYMTPQGALAKASIDPSLPLTKTSLALPAYLVRAEIETIVPTGPPEASAASSEPPELPSDARPWAKHGDYVLMPCWTGRMWEPRWVNTRGRYGSA